MPVIHEDRFGKPYKVPLHAVRFVRPARTKRVLSERQRESNSRSSAFRLALRANV